MSAFSHTHEFKVPYKRATRVVEITESHNKPTLLAG